MCYFKLEDVSYKYPLEDREILKNINLDIKKGEFWAVIGKNGSGKTTLCNVLRRFVPDFYKGELKGRITLEGKERLFCKGNCTEGRICFSESFYPNKWS